MSAEGFAPMTSKPLLGNSSQYRRKFETVIYYEWGVFTLTIMAISWRFVTVPNGESIQRFHELITDNAMPYLEAGCNIEMGDDGMLTINDVFQFPTTQSSIQSHMSGICDVDVNDEAVQIIVSLASHILGFEHFETDLEGDSEIDDICYEICHM